MNSSEDLIAVVVAEYSIMDSNLIGTALSGKSSCAFFRISIEHGFAIIACPNRSPSPAASQINVTIVTGERHETTLRMNVIVVMSYLSTIFGKVFQR